MSGDRSWLAALGSACLLAAVAFTIQTAPVEPDLHVGHPARVVQPHVEAEPWREPYGGCDEAYRYPHTPGWRACVRHGLIEVRSSNHLLPAGGGSPW